MWLKFWDMGRSRNNGESLTNYEAHLVLKEYAKCPDCDGYLLEGPCGGMSMNTLCESCGSEFCMTFLSGPVVIGNRISERGPRDPADRRRVYYNRIKLP